MPTITPTDYRSLGHQVPAKTSTRVQQQMTIQSLQKQATVTTTIIITTHTTPPVTILPITLTITLSVNPPPLKIRISKPRHHRITLHTIRDGVHHSTPATQPQPLILLHPLHQ
uniref:(northern house mosquito) hypothetical protein n=1 Tax=Culex pipiens TaxID=7175 RepID=A0A8D8I4J4_CULPI